MAVQTNKEKLCISQVVGQKTQTIMAETDTVVPDIKPDILNTIYTNGNVCITKQEIMEGKVRVEGFVNTYVMYVADSEKMEMRSLNTNIDFSEILDFEQARENMQLETNVTLRGMECRVLNGRKVNVKSMIEVEMKVESNEEIEFVREIKEVQDIQLLRENVRVSSLLGRGDTKVYAKDTIMLDDVDDLAEIMKVNVAVKNDEIKISYNKVLIKADAEVKILYRTEDGRVKNTINLIPVMGFIDMVDVADEHICQVKYDVRNIIIKPNNVEEHSIYIEVEMGANCSVYENKQMEVIQDLYSPSMNLIYKQKMIKATGEVERVKDICMIQERSQIAELQGAKIYDAEVRANIIKQTITKDKIMLEGEVKVDFIYSAVGNETIESICNIIPFNSSMNCSGVNQNSDVFVEIRVGTGDFITMPEGSIDMHIELEMMARNSQTREINVIDEIGVEENRQMEKHSIVIYFVKPGDSLWKIAKKFKSTVQDIVKVNNIEDENKIDIGEQLFIPLAG